MTDYYGQCKAGLETRLLTLAQYFPKSWQVSNNDAAIGRGAKYFAINRPGAFPSSRASGSQKDIEWHVTLLLHMSYKNQETCWDEFEAFRSDVFNLINSDPTLGGTQNVWDVAMDSNEEPGYLQDSEGNSQNIIVQACDVAITQRLPRTP